MLLHNSYYSDTVSQEVLILSHKTVQSLPHPVAMTLMITFSVAVTHSLLGVNVDWDSHDIDNERHDNKYYYGYHGSYHMELVDSGY